MVAGAAGRSCPEASVVLEANDGIDDDVSLSVLTASYTHGA